MGDKLLRGLCLGVLAAFALGAGCSSDDNKTAATGSSSSSTSSSSSSSSSSASSSSSSAATKGAAEALAGDYQGTWRNTTFGSQGGAAATITVDAAAKSISVNYDLNGSVFGAGDPPVENLVGTIGADGGASANTTSTLFGPITATLKPDGTFEMTASAVPSARIATFTMTGSVKPEGFTLTYTVTFKDGSSSAEGTLTMAPV